MKGAKGGNRDRIISWLFSEKNRKKREKELELEIVEENKIEEKIKDRRKNKNDIKERNDQEEKINISPPLGSIYVSNDAIEEFENKTHEDKLKDKNGQKNIGDNFDADPFNIHDNNRDKNKVDPTKQIEEIEETKSPKPKIIEQEIEDKEREDEKQKVTEHEVSTEKDPIEITEVPVRDVIELEKPELIKISIIEEIETLLRNDACDLRDIEYRISILQYQEKDEVLLENIEKIKKELDELIKRFNQIKDKYADLYGYISIKDMEFITGLGIGNVLHDYITSDKEGLDNSNTLNQINEIKEFIEIVNNIIKIEKKKEDTEKKVEQKLETFGIRDEEFVALKDKYANVEAINNKIEKYNMEIVSAFVDIEAKIANSADISKKIESTTSLVPDLNKIMNATILIASTKLIPPTPIGNLFKASLFISAAHMMATAITPKTERREITNVTVIDYSRDILVGKSDINSILSGIETAFDEIGYIKDTFEREFSMYANQIPEYNELIQNLFIIEKELARQKSIAQDYDYKLDESLQKNNQKVKLLENE